MRGASRRIINGVVDVNGMTLLSVGLPCHALNDWCWLVESFVTACLLCASTSGSKKRVSQLSLEPHGTDKRALTWRNDT